MTVKNIARDCGMLLFFFIIVCIAVKINMENEFRTGSRLYGTCPCFYGDKRNVEILCVFCYDKFE